jgi:hypothetical protein
LYREATLAKNAHEACRGFAAWWALQSAIAEGAHLIDLDAYQQVTGADCIEEYMTNKQLR